MEDKKLLNNEELERISGGASVLTEEEALKIAETLGEGNDMGSWKTMSGEEFMQLWYSTHEQ